MLLTGLFCMIAALSANTLMASPMVESNDRLEINWATMKIRFYGQSAVRTIDGGEGFKSAEKRAWQDGLSYASVIIDELYKKMNLSENSDRTKIEEAAKEAVHGVVTSTSSIKTLYTGDGEVRVYLENTVPKALAPKGIRFRQKEVNQGIMSEHTGLVLQLDRSTKPRVTYQVVDESGEILFGPSDMAEEAFRKTLMGRWYRRPTASELHDAVGRNPIIIPAAVLADGKIRVPKETWSQALEGHKSLLINGTIALAQP